MPDYTQMIIEPLTAGLRASVDEIFSMISGLLPILLPIVGAVALIYLGVGLFARIVNEATMERENQELVAGYIDFDYEDMMSDYFLFSDGEVDYTTEDEIGEWIGVDDGE